MSRRYSSPYQSMTQIASQSWQQHRLCLHNLKNYAHNAQIEYITSGLSSGEHSSLRCLFDKYPISPLNLPGCVWTPLHTTESETVIMEQGILSVKKTMPIKPASTVKSVISDPTEQSYTLDGSQMDTLIHILLSGWSPVELALESFRSLNLRMVLTIQYTTEATPLIQHLSIFWNQAELLEQLGIWKWLDEMKPGPALKNFVMRLPLQSHVPQSINHTSIRDPTSFTSTKVNCRQVGGMTNIILTDDPVPFSHQPSTKVQCKQVGGVDHFYNTTDDTAHSHPFVSPTIIPPWESTKTIPDSPKRCHPVIDHLKDLTLQEPPIERQNIKPQSQFSLSDMMKPDSAQPKHVPHLESHVSF